jgi:7,8-dihydropterin-6-yl-methyl-4-(beta-D-ribofuranosyl)aminobenzene 5'-phosphate synthase
MKVMVLVENSVCPTNLHSAAPKHGLSLYIEFADKKILFDVGPSDLFIKNAVKMGIDPAKVDDVFISHGHKDHGGGLRTFLQINDTAKVYVHEIALRKHFVKIFNLIMLSVGLDHDVIQAKADRFILVDKDLEIANGMFLLQGFGGAFPRPESNKILFEKNNKRCVPDMFQHETVLLLKEDDEAAVFTGCSHSGIINMVDTVKGRFKNVRLKAVFGGFHIFNPVNKKNESDAYIEKLVEAIRKIDSVFYTGHCTGQSNFKFLKQELGDQIQTLNTGEIIDI